MAKCTTCGLEQLEAKGCKFPAVVLNGKRYERIVAGDDPIFILEDDERCPDCGALCGYPHHYGCDRETCPICGEQMISCTCGFDFAE